MLASAPKGAGAFARVGWGSVTAAKIAGGSGGDTVPFGSVALSVPMTTFALTRRSRVADVRPWTCRGWLGRASWAFRGCSSAVAVLFTWQAGVSR